MALNTQNIPSEDRQEIATNTYRFAVPEGWFVEKTGELSIVRGPRREILQLSSAGLLDHNAGGAASSLDALRAAAHRTLEGLLADPELKVVEGLFTSSTNLGFRSETVLLRAPDNTFVMGAAIYGPSSVLIFTLDRAADVQSVETVKRAIMSVRF